MDVARRVGSHTAIRGREQAMGWTSAALRAVPPAAATTCKLRDPGGPLLPAAHLEYQRRPSTAAFMLRAFYPTRLRGGCPLPRSARAGSGTASIDTGWGSSCGSRGCKRSAACPCSTRTCSGFRCRWSSSRIPPSRSPPSGASCTNPQPARAAPAHPGGRRARPGDAGREPAHPREGRGGQSPHDRRRRASGRVGEPQHLLLPRTLRRGGPTLPAGLRAGGRGRSGRPLADPLRRGLWLRRI